MCDEIITVKPDLVFTEKGVSGKVIIFPQYMLLVHSLARFKHKPQQLIVDTGPPCLRYLYQVVQTQTMAAYCRILSTLDHHV